MEGGMFFETAGEGQKFSIGGTQMKAKVKALLLVAAFLISMVGMVSASGVQPQYPNKYKQVMAQDGFIYGINVPQFTSGTYGTDIGNNPVLSTATSFDTKKVTEIFTNCKAIGFNCIRIQLFESMEGLTFDDSGDVTGFDSSFLPNLKSLLDIAKDTGVNLDLVLQPHVDANLNKVSKATYDKYTQVIFNPTVRQHYIDKVVTPLCDLLKDYQDNILFLDIYGEPEADVYGQLGNGSASYGTTWENMASYLKAVGQAIKQVMPEMPITASSGLRDYNSLKDGQYNELGLDLIGVNDYNDFGDVAAIKSLRVTKPVILSEFGVKTATNLSNDFQQQSTMTFYANAKAAGYRGAFYYMYGYKDASNTLTLFDQNNHLRPVCSAIHFAMLDNSYDRDNLSNVADKPVFLYGTSVYNISWFGTRNADSYTVERSEDGTNWTVLAKDIEADTIDNGNSVCTYSDTTVEEGKSYYYRVSAKTDDGLTAVSDPSSPFLVAPTTCTPDKNVFQNNGFETGDITGFSNSGIGTVEVVSGAVGDTVYSGSHALHVVGTSSWANVLSDKFTLEKNTTYTFTMFVKAKANAGGSGSCIGMMDQNWNPVNGAWMTINYDNTWHKYTCDFNTGDNTTFQWRLGDGGGEFYVDDFYLFKTQQ